LNHVSPSKKKKTTAFSLSLSVLIGFFRNYQILRNKSDIRE